MSDKAKSIIKRTAVYLLGCLIIALGINVSKMSGLGISPVSSIPRALEVAWGFSLGTMVILTYCVLVLLQFVVLGKDFKIINVLGVPVAVVFGWMVDFLGINPATFGHLLYGFPRPETYFAKVIYLIASIIIIAFGVSIYLKPNLVPMPAEGLAKAISDKTKKPFGDCKTFVDMSLITIALVIQLVFLGGFSSFTGENIVVREGTFLSALLVGQTVKLINRKIFVSREKTDKEDV